MLVLMAINPVPCTSVVLAGWLAGLLHAGAAGETARPGAARRKRDGPSPVLVAVVGSATALGAAGSMATWLFKESPEVWMPALVLSVTGTVGLGLWAPRRARKEPSD